ncbi:hypothetical protein KY326_03215 [Candidatus Woesearchaeota archaeon]|nr:hypothetical protein [Candidatus Woesearchaeota archaeon]
MGFVKKRFLFFIILLFLLIGIAIVSGQRSIPIIPIQITPEPSCEDYCSDGKWYSSGYYSDTEQKCIFRSVTDCEYGCDYRGCIPSFSIRPTDTVSIQPEIPTIKPETVSKIPKEPIGKVPTKVGEKCHLDEDGIGKLSKGKVGHWIVPDVDVPPAEIGKWGDVEIKFAPVEYEWDAEDKCISKDKVLDYYCITTKSQECLGEMGVKQLGTGGAITAKQVEELKDSYCIIDPFSKEVGYIGTVEIDCKCGCSNGRCLDEIDTDYDKILDCIDDDDDNDGVIDIKDNCPLIKNNDQSDKDKDLKGDVCDNCPYRQNKDQADVDEDTVGDACDNCKDHKNPDQNDTNGNYVGDACDCRDAIKGPNEYDVDCGLICPLCLEDDCRNDPNWCGDVLEPIRIKGKYNQGFIDVVFVPDYHYTSNEQFKQDSIELVQEGFAKLQAKSNLPINQDYFDKFNFYIYNGGILDGKHHYDYTADASFKCTGFPPTNIAGYGLGGKIAPFHDNLVILCPNGTSNCSGCSKLGPSINHKLRTRAGLPNLLVHEASHGVFSLQDEYCGDTFYTKISAMSNIFDSYELCEVARKSGAWKDGKCRKICSEGKDWTITNSIEQVTFYRWDSDDKNHDMMTACGVGCGHDYRYKEADVPRINWMLDKWPKSKTPAIFVNLEIDREGVRFKNTNIVGAHPDLGMQEEHFRVKILDNREVVLLEYPISDPRINMKAAGFENAALAFEESSEFSVAVPISFDVAEMQLMEGDRLLISVDLEDVVADYCKANLNSDECRGTEGPKVTQAKPTVFTRIRGFFARLFS